MVTSATFVYAALTAACKRQQTDMKTQISKACGPERELAGRLEFMANKHAIQDHSPGVWSADDLYDSTHGIGGNLLEEVRLPLCNSAQAIEG